MAMEHHDERKAIARAFHERFIALLEEAGVDASKGEHVARHLGLSKGTGYNLITPGRLPQTVTLPGIARTLNTTTDYLLGASDKRDPPGTRSLPRAQREQRRPPARRARPSNSSPRA